MGHGCYNTFVIIDNLPNKYSINDTRAIQLLHATNYDDLIFISTQDNLSCGAAFDISILEPNNTFADFCGNGARVVGEYLFNKYPSLLPWFYINTRLGKCRVTKLDDGSICVNIPATKFSVQTKFVAKANKFLDNVYNLSLGSEILKLYYAETLEPHLIILDKISDDDLVRIGQYINFELREVFPLGIHVNASYHLTKNILFVRTYERSLYRLTQSCGTGSISCASLLNYINKKNIARTVKTKGGVINISEILPDNTINMSGKAIITGGPYNF